MFDEKTQQQLCYYVYALFSDNEQFPFYIGKGINNRVFDHLRCAIAYETSESLKYEKLRQSKNVNHVIVRHGLSEGEAFTVESSLIDIFNFIKHPLTNIVGGHNTIEKGLMTSDEVIRRYNAETLEKMPDNSVIININGTYKRGCDKDAIYTATKEIWVIKKKLLDKIKYVMSEYHGLIVEVFEVDEWYEKERGYGKNSKKAGQKRIGYGFHGRIAPNEIRDLYLNKSIKQFKLKGQANPVRFTLNKKPESGPLV
jgi:hypothetical protein